MSFLPPNPSPPNSCFQGLECSESYLDPETINKSLCGMEINTILVSNQMSVFTFQNGLYYKHV